MDVQYSTSKLRLCYFLFIFIELGENIFLFHFKRLHILGNHTVLYTIQFKITVVDKNLNLEIEWVMMNNISA